MATLTLRLPDELDRELETLSAEAGISKSDIAREALRRYVRIAEVRSLRAKLVPEAQAQGIHTDEDVFRRLGKQ